MMYILVFIVAVLIDQLTKLWAISNLKGQAQIKLVDNWLHLTYLENSGAAWGIFQNATLIFALMTILICFGICWYLLKNSNNIDIYIKIPLVIILAGAIGNLIDRLRLQYVVDFIYTPLGGLYDFPVFNFADMFVSLSAIFLIIYVYFFEAKK
ncbi:signal peptidase II [Helcococcus ovis]|uniref:Lipoprotein signal peptidase n=1 Tax=Helcococcus ovis TaxID=72026 RepID=A0A4R9C024_9FIRM|nr:signal peptidase II [Helcococcus ovis]TFF64472.1 signal peptidase II [Helcococcus ovis]TFF64906.1 signal peptidase II [Helcococcus ovis]TFF68118.1 signal peptidase II [Helcococcus ovis]WNZ01976.1 signal peptidase II [Helcococcus ovis]